MDVEALSSILLLVRGADPAQVCAPGCPFLTKELAMTFVLGLVCGTLVTPALVLLYTSWVYARKGELFQI
ncbi:MAG: hypothetical protein NVS2B16_06990 [Chloroflexota bacterium]